MMKCPKCQSELEGDGTCRNCSEGSRSADDRFNVSFKKFGTSELLEISPKKKDVKASSVFTQKPKNPRSSRTLQTKSADDGNKAFLFAAGAVLIIVFATAVFFWFFYGRH